MSARTTFPDSLDPTTLWALRAVLVPMHPTIASHPDLKAITVLLASTASPERGGLAYLDAVLPAEDRLAATRVVRDLGALPPDAILFLLAQPLLDLASDELMRDRDLTARYEERFEVEDSDEGTAAMVDYNREADAITAPLFRAQGEPLSTSTSRIGAASTAGWSAAGNTSSGRRAARTPPICGRRPSSTDRH